MDLTMKIVIFSAILVSDVIAGLLIIRKLNAEGQGDKIFIVIPALGIGLIVTGVVLFGVIE